MLNYKPVKNRNKPGRPPSGCIWAKDEEGQKIFNEQGELAYREPTPEEVAAKAAEKAAKAAKKSKKQEKYSLFLQFWQYLLPVLAYLHFLHL